MIHLIEDYWLDSDSTCYKIRKKEPSVTDKESAPFVVIDKFADLKDALRYVMDIAVRNYIGGVEGYNQESMDALVTFIKDLLDRYNRLYELFFILGGGKKNDSTD